MTELENASKLQYDKQVTSRIIQNESEWDAIENEWNALYDASPYASTPLHFDWLRAWWRVYGATYGAGGLQIITVWRGVQLIGVFPLYLGCRKSGPFKIQTLCFISTGEEEYEETCPDYMNLLCIAGEEVVSTTAVWNVVNKLKWDQLELLDIPSNSHVVCSQTTQTYSRGSCHIANIEGGFDTYLGRVSSKSRRNFRRLLRDMDKTEAIFEIVELSKADQVFDELINIHQERWKLDGKLGVFSAPNFVEFHRNLLSHWLPEGRAILARLSIDGNPVAVVYAFINGSKCDLYLCGIKRNSAIAIESPGVLIYLLMMQELEKRGITSLDFLRGSSFYKNSLATYECELISLSQYRISPRTILFKICELTNKAVRKVLMKLKHNKIHKKVSLQC